jgi:hypothetical protein
MGIRQPEMYRMSHSLATQPLEGVIPMEIVSANLVRTYKKPINSRRRRVCL